MTKIRQFDRPIVWSYGGGTQSVALAVLISQGKLPVPERAVIADTSYEGSVTWAYTDRFVRPLLEPLGLQVEIAPHSLATYDLYDRQGRVLIPAWTGSGGQLQLYCSGNWKRDVISRWLASPERGYGPKNPVIQWIGMSRDEIGRCKPSKVKWIDVQWPLIMGYGLCLRRDECRRLVEEAGLPTPPRSACWMCPYRRNSEWRDLRDNHPADWRAAVEFDEMIRRNDPRQDMYVHRSGVPLREADLSERDPGMNGLFGEVAACDGGVCWH